MQFFEDEFDADETIEGLLDAFPLRVRIGSMETQYSRTGSEIGGAFVPLSSGEGSGYLSIPATKSGGAGTKRQQVTLESGETGTIALIWTLLGSWPLIQPKMLLQVVDSITGDITGQTHEVLLSDVHDFGIHTEVRTRAA